MADEIYIEVRGRELYVGIRGQLWEKSPTSSERYNDLLRINLREAKELKKHLDNYIENYPVQKD